MKKFICVLLVLVASTAQAGLKEKKWEKQQAPAVAEYEAKIESSCGCLIPIAVEWKTADLTVNKMDPKRCASSAHDGIKRVCKDFKAEICEGVKKIMLSESPDGAKLDVKDGVLHNQWGSDSTSCLSGQSVQKTLENSL